MHTINIHLIKDFLDNSFKEDINYGDITSCYVTKDDDHVSFDITCRENMIISGTPILEYLMKTYSNIEYEIYVHDSEKAIRGDVVLSGAGDAKEILQLERVMLNYLQHLSSIATYTKKFVSSIHPNSKSKIYDTRKTTPGLRMLEKYAVTCGGGYNHRMSLHSSIMIKDNHIAVCGSIQKAISLAKKYKSHYMTIEIECDTLQQVKEAIDEGVDIIMLDNMSIEKITQAVKIINDQAMIEVSGGVTLDQINELSQIKGISAISIGKITQSAPVVDISLEVR